MPRILQKHKFLFAFLLVFVGAHSSFSQKTIQDSIADINTLQEISKIALSNQNFDEAIISLNKAKKLAKLLNQPIPRYEVSMQLAKLNYYIKNYTKAETYIDDAIAIVNSDTHEDYLGDAFTLKGLIATRLWKLDLAEEQLKKADRIFTKNNDELSRTNVVLGFGVLEYYKGNFTAAINYFDASIPVFKENNLKYQEAFALLNKAQTAIKIDATTEYNPAIIADEALLNAESIINENGYNRLKAESYKIKGDIALFENNVKAASKAFEEFHRRSDSLNQVYIEAISKGVDKDENIISLTDKIEKQENALEKQARSINFAKMTAGLSVALIIILSLLTLSLYKNNNLRAKANNLLQDKNNELILAKEKAEKASIAKAQFLSTITHELRTPLYAVTGLTHLLLEEDPKEHQKDHLNSLKFSGDYLLSLINNILDLNKLEANKVEIEKTTFSLKKRINDVLIALKKSGDDRKNNLILEYDESIPSKLIGDPLKLSQILINLIGNSVKFTQNGDVTVRIKKIDEKGSSVSLNFEVEDNGVGISKKKQKSIFESFSQASLQINRKFGGTGLGLSIVKNLLEIMGSKIHLESQLGKGSKFWFNLSLGISEEAKESLNSAKVVLNIDYKALENKNVLVVEDNKINQMITKKILEKNKMICQVADNGMDAIKLVEENDFDIILMDIHMPGISGIEATQRIRGFDKELPIIALTAVTIDENLDEFYRAGFNEIIPKPFKTEEFFEKIYRTIQSRKTAYS